MQNILIIPNMWMQNKKIYKNILLYENVLYHAICIKIEITFNLIILYIKN